MQWWCAAQGVAWSWTWRPYPGVWLFVGLWIVLFTRLLRSPEPGGAGVWESFGRRTRAVLAAAGILLLWAALDWPLGTLGAGYLASVHMVQFLLIAIAAPPLLLLGVPEATWEAWLSRRAAGGVARALGHPLISLSVFTGMIGLTHWPTVVDGLMASQLGSLALDLSWLMTGLVFWWPVAVARPVRPWLTEPFKMGYLIAATIVNTSVFAYLAFSDLPVYATFELAPPVGGLSTRDDQLVAGFLMKLGGALVFWTAITILFFRWFRRSEREARGVAATLLLAVLVIGCGPRTGGGLEIETAVVTEPVTGERAALYMTLVNRGRGDRLVGVEVDDVADARLHQTDTAGGMMRMQPIPEGLDLPAHETVRLEPGGAHVMLEGLERALVPGDSVGVTLRFGSAPAVHVQARVVALGELEAALGGH